MSEQEEGGPEIGIANETIVLEGKEFVIRPTAGMALILGRGPEGFFGAHRRVRKMDPDTIYQVISLGLPIRVPEQRLRNAIYETGYLVLSEPCGNVVTSLIHGGRKPPPDPKPEDEQEGGDPLAPSA